MLTRNFGLILLSNIVLGAPMPMLIILGGLAGAQLSPFAYGATLPPSVQMLAGILVATPISIYMGRAGRKAGFLVGVFLMVLGGGIGVAALIWGSFFLLCLAHFLLGGALVCINFFRFAAAESVAEKWKSNAISLTLASGIVAAIVGPAIFKLSTGAILSADYAGAYLAISILGLVGLIPVLCLRDLPPVADNSTASNTNISILLRKPNVAFAIGAGAVSYGVMVLLMTPTALAMVGYGYGHGQASEVIKWHVIAMFAPGFITGSLINRVGTSKIIIIGLVVLGLSAVVAIMGISLPHFFVSLILLGIGWNFGFIGSTTLLQSSLEPHERPVIQGANDTIIAISSSAASLLSGVLYVGLGWAAIAVVALPVVGCTILYRFFMVKNKV